MLLLAVACSLTLSAGHRSFRTPPAVLSPGTPLHPSNTSSRSPSLWPPPGYKDILFYVGPQTGIPPLGHHGQLHSQCGQDWLVGSLLGCKRGGFFLDLAANNATRWSDSLALERDFDWNGICVEPNPKYQPGLLSRRCRVVSAVVGGPTDSNVTFDFRDGPSDDSVFGGIVGEAFDNKAAHAQSHTRQMRTVALEDLLKAMHAPALIDYMSLDVEGAQNLVLKDFPWTERRFRVMTLERPDPDLVSALTANGYVRLRRNSGFDDETWLSAALHRSVAARFGSDDWNKLPARTCMDERGFKKPVFPRYFSCFPLERRRRLLRRRRE